MSAADSPSVQANANLLRQVLRESGLKIRDALVVIPKQWVTLRVVTLPTTEAAELAETGLADWGGSLPEGDEGLVDAGGGKPVRWVEGRGWVEESA